MTLPPGVLFKCQPCGLYPTSSTDDRAEAQPDPKMLYVLCSDGSVHAFLDPARPIGWKLGEGSYNIIHGGDVGSRKYKLKLRGFVGHSASQDANIAHAKDEGEEVTSSISFNAQR